jgi:hypothetical protein
LSTIFYKHTKLGSILSSHSFIGVDFQVVEITDTSYKIQQTFSGEIKEYAKTEAAVEFYYQYDLYYNLYDYRSFYASNKRG